MPILSVQPQEIGAYYDPTELLVIDSPEERGRPAGIRPHKGLRNAGTRINEPRLRPQPAPTSHACGDAKGGTPISFPHTCHHLAGDPRPNSTARSACDPFHEVGPAGGRRMVWSVSKNNIKLKNKISKNKQNGNLRSEIRPWPPPSLSGARRPGS